MSNHQTDAATGHRQPLSASRPVRIRNDQEAIQTAQALAQNYAASAAQRDRERILPWQEIEAFTASGLGGITVPARFGGADVSYLTLARVFAIISEADPSLGQIPQNHFAVLQLLRETGTPQQQARWFADVLNGHRIGNAGPERKARAGLITQPTTHIVRTAEGLRLNGTRFYSTGALFAHWIPLRALHESGHAVQVWVRRDAPGVTVVDDWDAFGQRTTASGSVVLENVPIDEADIVDMSDVPTRPNLAGPVSQLIHAAIDAGIARSALLDGLAFVRDHSRPWVDAGVAQASEDPYIIQEAGKLQIEVDAAHAVLEESAATLDSIAQQLVTDKSSAQASNAVALAKILTGEAAINASEQLLALAGSASTREKHNLDRHWRNARVHTLHDPVRWKYHSLGDFLLNGTLPRRHQWN